MDLLKIGDKIRLKDTACAGSKNRGTVMFVPPESNRNEDLIGFIIEGKKIENDITLSYAFRCEVEKLIDQTIQF